MLYLIIFLVSFLFFAALRVPVPFSMGIGTMFTIAAAGLKFELMPPAAFSGVDAFAFLAVPAFIYAGDLMAHGGVSTALLEFIGAILKRIRGSLGAVAVVSSALFGSITGSSLATVSAIGGIMLPEMVKNGYNKPYATALIAASGFLGILVPPSVPGVIYAVTAGLPVAQVWLATLGPAIVLALFYMLVNYFVYGKKQAKILEPFKMHVYLQEVGKTTPRALIAFLMPIVIFVGVYGGVFTPTEAGAVSVAVGVIIGWFIFPLVFKARAEKSFWSITLGAALTSAAIMMIIAFAHAVSDMFSFSGISMALTAFVLNYTTSPVVFLLAVNILLLIVGMFMETNTSILLFAPLLIPAAKELGIDPIHFSAVVLLNLEIGMITPPFAVNLFTACRIANLPMDVVIKPLLPFLAVCLVVLLLTTYIPAIPLALVNLIFQ